MISLSEMVFKKMDVFKKNCNFMRISDQSNSQEVERRRNFEVWTSAGYIDVDDGS